MGEIVLLRPCKKSNDVYAQNQVDFWCQMAAKEMHLQIVQMLIGRDSLANSTDPDRQEQPDHGLCINNLLKLPFTPFQQFTLC